jgi:hypothetical protein
MRAAPEAKSRSRNPCVPRAEKCRSVEALSPAHRAQRTKDASALIAENAAAEQRKQRGRGPGRPWPRGVSGNPAGKKPGTRNRATMLGQELLDAQAPNLVRKAISMAIRGDVAALRICMDRIVPVARHRTVRFSLPTLSSAKDASAAMAAVLAAVAEGTLTPDEVSELSNLVANFVKTLEVTALGERIEALEKGNE